MYFFIFSNFKFSNNIEDEYLYIMEQNKLFDIIRIIIMIIMLIIIVILKILYKY